MREGVTSSETIGYGQALLKYTAQGSQQTRPVSGALTVVAQHLQTPRTMGMRTGPYR